MNGMRSARRGVLGALAVFSLAGCAHPIPPGTCFGGALRITLTLPDGGEAPLPAESRLQVISMEFHPDFPAEDHGVYRCAPTGECRSITVDPKLKYMALPQNLLFFVKGEAVPPEGLVVRADFKVLERPACTPEF
ncbi:MULTISPECIES: hypothetical protein [unclassified Caulobacter]|jgi:hypothetical protein|uniref:hypothetical protein n=1 Tax=unclassified Caulobacter TaxID=2648921 RepID=UPI0006FE7CAD|nr:MULTISPECIES: hypothetical protein [unclassified Caulobacter]